MSNTDIVAQNIRPVKQVGERIGDILVVSNIAQEVTTVSSDREAILAVYHNLATVSTSEKYAEEAKLASEKSREYARLAMSVVQGGSGTWLEGPQGEKGDQGDTGDRGEKGDQGDTGEKGATGDRGPQGLQGVPGVAGSLGAQGLQGVPGIQGIQGLAGPQGNTGPAGENAAAALNPRGDFELAASPLYTKNDYITATNGNTYVCKLNMPEANIPPTTGDSADPHWQLLAIAGARGLQGIQGDTGQKGETGEKGDKGDKGEAGVAGAQGDQGEQGIAGTQGTQGLQGIQGEQGLKGDKGEAGVGIPLGGLAGQALVKASALDLELAWANVTGGGGGGAGSTWEDLQNKPTAFSPIAHASSHAMGSSDPILYSSLSGLPDLNLKQDKLPDFTNHAGKFLSTDGTIVAWKDIFSSNLLTIYVSKSGNDNNTGLACSPFLTIGRAVEEIKIRSGGLSSPIEAIGNYWISVLLEIDEGLYSEDINLVHIRIPMMIRGKITGSKTRVFSLNISSCAYVFLENLEFGVEGRSKNTIQVMQSSCYLIGGMVIIGGTSSNYGLYATQGTLLTTSHNVVSFVGSFYAAIASEYLSLISFPDSGNITFNNVTSSESTVVCRYNSMMAIGTTITSHGTISGKRFKVDNLASIRTNGKGLNHIPGNAAGVALTATGGYYS